MRLISAKEKSHFRLPSFHLLAFCLSPSVALLHVALPFFLHATRFGWGRLPLASLSPGSAALVACTMLLNFCAVWAYLLLLSVCLMVFKRLSHFLTIFSWLSSESQAFANGLPHSELRSAANLISWMKLRAVCSKPKAVPLVAASAVYSFAFLLAAFLWVVLLVTIFSPDFLLSTTFCLLFLDALGLTVFLVATLSVAWNIDNVQNQHTTLLIKEQLKMNLEIEHLWSQQPPVDAQLIGELGRSVSSLSLIIALIRDQSSGLIVMGIPLTGLFARVCLGLTFPLVVSTTTHFIATVQ